MHPVDEPQLNEQRRQETLLPPIPSWTASLFKRPLSMRHLYGLGILVVGGGIPFAAIGGGVAGLGLGAMVIVILGMAMLHDGGWTRRPRHPVSRTRKRSAVRSRGKGRHRTAAKRGRSAQQEIARKATPDSPHRGDGGLLPPADEMLGEQAGGELHPERGPAEQRSTDVDSGPGRSSLA